MRGQPLNLERLQMNATEIALMDRLAKQDRQMDLYEKLRRQHGYLSIWSNYTVEDFNDVPFPDIKEVIYQAYWPHGDLYFDEDEVRKLTYLAMGDITWADLWKISEYLINKSGDTHHIFIESFQDLGNGVYELWTGS